MSLGDRCPCCILFVVCALGRRHFMASALVTPRCNSYELADSHENKTTICTSSSCFMLL